MPTLALDTSSAISVAVVDGDIVFARDSVFAPRGHAELLAPMIRDVLARAGLGLSGDVGGAGIGGAGIHSIVVGTGPAPFTGLRVGLVTAKTLALAWGVPVWGVCSLDALGAANSAAHGGAVTVVADARRREVYWARYEGGERVEGPGVALPSDVPAVAGAGSFACVGRGAALYPEVFGEAPPESEWHPDPAWLARIAARRLAASTLATGGFATDGPAVGGPSTDAGDLGVEPLYLRRPDVHGTPPS